jgi:uncharacterized protein (DUF1800 family)
MQEPIEPELVCEPTVPAAPITDQTPVASAENGGAAIERRKVFAGAGAVIFAAAVAHMASPQEVTAEERRPAPALRSPHHPVTAAAGGPPPLPALAVVALNRMGFGPRPGDIAAFNALAGTPEACLEAYVEQQLNPSAIDDSACDAIIANHQFQTLGKSITQLWADHVRRQGVSWNERTQPMWETEQATFLKAVYSKRQLLEVLADHWHNHFNIYGRDYWTAPVWVHYDRDVIRSHLLGNFRQMVQAVGQSPAMLYYLDNQSNSGGNPNENYARELFELHTMGAENYFGVKPLGVGPDGSFVHPAPKDANGRPLLYVDEDVYGATTCFTGWRVDADTGLFKFDAAAHFPYQKIVLGRAIPAAQGIQDGYDVLNILARHPGTARHIARKLCRRLISDRPPESVVQAAADTFMANLDAADQLKQVVRTILLSPEFRTTWGQKIKRPFEYAVSLLRAAEADFTMTDQFRWTYQNMGQELFSWNPPNGYPDFKEPWSGTMPMLQRWRLVNWLIEWKYGGDGPNKDERRLRFNHPPAVTTATAIVDYWSQRLLGYKLPAHERQQVIEFMAYGRQQTIDLPAKEINDRLRYMIALIFQSPSFQWR